MSEQARAGARRAGLGGVGGLVVVLLASTGAAAHTELRGSAPAGGGKLSVPPERIELVFTEPVDRESAQLTLSPGSAAAPVELDPVATGPRLSAAVPADLAEPAPDGSTWTVSYRVVSADSHPVAGRVRFQVAGTASASSNPPAAPPTSEPPAEFNRSESDGSQTLATIVIGLITAVGTVGVMYLLARGRGPS